MARRVTLLVLLVLLAAPAFADVDGFRGMRWGERLEDVAMSKPLALESSNKADDTVVYTARDDRLWLGPARLEDIRYTFWKGRLYTVFLGTRGYEDFQRIKQVAFERFGAFDQPPNALRAATTASRASLREPCATFAVIDPPGPPDAG